MVDDYSPDAGIDYGEPDSDDPVLAGWPMFSVAQDGSLTAGAGSLTGPAARSTRYSDLGDSGVSAGFEDHGYPVET